MFMAVTLWAYNNSLLILLVLTNQFSSTYFCNLTPCNLTLLYVMMDMCWISWYSCYGLFHVVD